MTILLRFAGTFNLLAGAGMFFLHHEGCKLLGIAQPPVALPIQVVGILVALFGVGYHLVAVRPVENRNILVLGWWSKALSSATARFVRGRGPLAMAVRAGRLPVRRDLPAAFSDDHQADRPAAAGRRGIGTSYIAAVAGLEVWSSGFGLWPLAFGL